MVKMMNEKQKLYWYLRRLFATICNAIIFIFIAEYLLELHEYISTNISNWLDYEIFMNAVDPNHIKLSLGTRIWRSIEMESPFFSPPLAYILLTRLITKHWITRSIGQKIFSLEVKRIDGKNIDFFIGLKRLLIPCMLYPILCFYFYYNSASLYLVVFVLIVVDFSSVFYKNGRCLHDLIAGTKVISSR